MREDDRHGKRGRRKRGERARESEREGERDVMTTSKIDKHLFSVMV